MAGAIVFCVANIYLPLGRLAENNAETLRRVHCEGPTCDTSEINADPELVDAGYVLDTYNYYLLGTPTIDVPGFILRHADLTLIRRFETPGSFQAADGEVWRLCSAVKQVGGSSLAVMVGYAERASWKMDLPIDIGAVDKALRGQLDMLLDALREDAGRVDLGAAARRRVVADGYTVIDTATAEVLYHGYSLPMYFPRSQPLPRPGASFYRHGRALYVVRADSNGRLLAVRMNQVGDLPSILVLAALILAGGSLLGYKLGMTFLRRFFVLTNSSAQTLDEALRLGEGLTIEFKRSISFDVPNSVDRVLETIAAFANTAHGTLFIGVEDNGRINGLHVEGLKGRDALTERIHQAVRNRIRPAPVIAVVYVEWEGNTVCRIFVPRGDQPLHLMDGVIYVRDGAADIKAPPERVVKLVEEFAV